MRIAVDATALLDPPTGIGLFTGRLLAGLRAREGVEPVAYAASWRGRHRLASAVPTGIATVTRPLPARPARALWQRADLPPVEWWTGPVSVVHGPNFVVPPTRDAAAVVTVHDLTTVHHPELCDRSTLAFPALVQRAIDRGAWVHTVSRFVADEVRECFRVDPNRVVAVHNGIDPVPPVTEAAPDAGGPPTILALGTVEPRKDLPGLVEAFDRIAGRHPALRLVVAGPDGWGVEAFEAAVAAARHGDRIDRLGWVDEQRRRSLLAGASVLAYPSRYEGFGLPPLEAMAAGTPVVATRAGALPEVLGEAAVMVAVGDIEALADGLERVITDDGLAADLVARGRDRAARYDWTSCVDGIVDLYVRAVG